MASHTSDRTENAASNAADHDVMFADDATDTMGEKYSRRAKDKLDSPITSLLVLSAVLIGGSMLVAAVFHDERNGSGESGRPMRLAAAVNGLGPRGTETLGRIRDAAFSFVLDKAVDTFDGMFPGFRQHYERG